MHLNTQKKNNNLMLYYKMPNSTKVSDLTHEDWVLNSQKALIIEADNNISTNIVTDSEGMKTLVVSNVTEAVIDSLRFITNTDQNNNYLYISDFQVYINNNPLPIPIPGLSDTVKLVYYNNDINAFLSGRNTHTPFRGTNYQQDCLFNGNTFAEFSDFFSSAVPLSPTTIGYTKTFSFIVDPDRPDPRLYQNGG